MTKNNVLKLLLLYGLIKFSDQTNFESDLDSDKCIQCNIPKIRVKRAKYFQSPSIRYFKRPNFPPNYFSYTPPPNFLMNDEEQTRGPNKMYPNKKSNTQNLNDEDINNLVKNLSKGDLDRILEFAGDLKQKESYLHSNIRVNYEDQTQNNVNSISDDSTVYREQFNQQNYINAPYASNINDGFNKMMPDNTIAPPVLFTDNRNTMEEILPKPVNLREEPRFMNDYQILNSKKVPVAVAPTDSYKVENFGALPLSGHNSKLSSVSSYHVPHYTVTTNKMTSAAASSYVPKIEAAPSAESSAAYAQSDAHLKAIKIWTHRSKGTAYTLHSDGTLSLEFPSKPRPKYFHP